jgi:hypothetical protein
MSFLNSRLLSLIYIPFRGLYIYYKTLIYFIITLKLTVLKRLFNYIKYLNIKIILI